MTDQNQGQNWAVGLTDDTATKAAPQAQTAPQQAAPQVAPGSDWAAGLTDQTATHAMTAAEKSNAAVDRMQKEAPPVAANGGFTWEGLKAAPGRFASGIGQVAKFAADAVRDSADLNKPLFISNEGAAPGSQGESTLYKYLFAPQVEQFGQAQEMARQANEEYGKGNDIAGRRNQLEAWGHWGASVIPVVGPWLGGQAEQAGKTGDILGTTAETLGQVVGGELLHKGVEVGIDRTTRMAGALAEGVATKAGASPEVARTVGNIASLGTKNISIDAHVDALDKAVDDHIKAKTDFEAKTAAVDAAKTAAAADPKDVNAKANLETAQKALDKSSSAYDKAGDAVDKVQDKILSELSPYDWSKLSPAHIVDIAQSAIGITDDFDTAVIRFANMAGKQAGQAFKSALSSVREDLKAIINGDTDDKIVDPKTAADAIDAHIYQNIENPLQETAGATRNENSPVVENFRARVEQRIDKFFAENPGKAGSVDEEQRIKQQMLDRVMRSQDLGNGTTAPREPNLYEAESIRQGLKKYEPNETSGYNQAAYELANFMREMIDEGYGKRGVDGVKEARAKEAKLITISEGLRKAQPLFETQEGTPTFRKVIKASGAVLLASTLGTALLHNPLGALTGLGELWAKLYDSNAKDLSKNLDRTRELAGREPGATATTPELGTRPLESPAPEMTRPPDTPPNMPPPPPPPVPAARPPINHTLGGELAAHFPDVTEEPTTPEEFDALLKRFLSDYSEKLQGVKDFQAQNPGKPLPDGVKDEWDAAKDLKGKIMRERAKENAATDKENQKRQDKYQSDLAKYNAKYQSEVAKAAEKAKADAQAAADKAKADADAKSDALKNDPRIIHGAGGLMPATEPVRHITGAGDHTSDQAHGHEGGGHTIAYASQGLDPFEFISDTHPEAIKKGAAAAIRTRIDAAAPGAEGVFQRVIGMLGGPAWDEVHSDMPNPIDYPEGNRAARGDIKQAKDALRDEAGLTPSEIEVVLKELYNTAKEVVSKPEAVALAKANIAVREVGLPDTHHMSETRMTDYVKALKGVFGNGETKTPTPDGGVSGKADGAVPERESNLGGAEAKQPTGSAEKVPAGEVRASEGESEEGARGSGRGVEQAEIKKSELPPQPRLPDEGTYPAIQTDDGGIYYDKQATGRTHIMFAKDAGIPAERVTSGGWIKDGVYEPSSRSDAERWGEQARAKSRSEAAREQAKTTVPLEGERVEQADLRKDTHSPLRQNYPIEASEGGETTPDTIPAFSPREALKAAAKKYPNAEVSVGLAQPIEREAGYRVPTGKHLTTPESREGKQPVESTMIHELGHYMVGHNEGMTSGGIFRHTRPDMPRNANAAVNWPMADLVDNRGRIKPEVIPGLIRMIAGGAAADEVFKGQPAANSIQFDTRISNSDGAMILKILKSAGYSTADALDMREAALKAAKEHLTKPAVADIIKENAGVREPGLSNQFHYSPERLKAMGDEATRRLNGEPNNGAVGGENGEGRGGNVGGGEGGAAPAVGEEAVTEPKSILDTAREQEHGVEQSNLSKAKAKDVLDKIVGKYGTSDNVEPLRRDHSFILPDGKLVHLEGTQHGDAIAEHGGGNSNEKNGWDNRPEFINKSGAVRALGYQDRAGDSLSFSVPKDGVTREQADTMNRAASQPYMRNGNLKVERADIKAATANELHRQKDFPRVGDIHEMLRQIGAHPDQVEQSNLTKYQGPEPKFTSEEDPNEPESSLNMHVGDKHVGTINYFDSPEDKSLIVSSSSILPEFRNQGLGDRLYQGLFDHAREKGYNRVESDTSLSPDAKRMWDSLVSRGLAVKDSQYGTYHADLNKPEQVAEHEKNGGSTFTPEGQNLSGKDLYAVGAHPKRTVQVDKLTPETLDKFKADNADLLKDGTHAVGTWKDPETGKSVLDIVATHADEEAAKAHGVAANQKSIYHLGGKGEIPTGGTGDYHNTTLASPADYEAALRRNPNTALIRDHGQEMTPAQIADQMKDRQLIQWVKDGKPQDAFVGVDKNGNISRVVNNQKDAVQSLDLIRAAINRGGNKIDAWDIDGKLPKIYEGLGFKEVRNVPYDEQNYGKPSDALMDHWKRFGWDGEKPYPSISYMELPKVEQSNLGKSPKGSTVPIMTGGAPEVKGTGEKGKVSTMDVANALNEYSQSKNPALELKDENQKKMVERGAKLGEDEAKYQLAQGKTGTEWYTEEMKDHDKVAKEMRPELAGGEMLNPTEKNPELAQHPVKMSLFKASEGILSSGQKPYANFKSGVRSWDHYNETGQFSPYNPASELNVPVEGAEPTLKTAAKMKLTGRTQLQVGDKIDTPNGPQQIVGKKGDEWVTGKSWGPRGLKAYGDAFNSLNQLISDKGEKGAADWLLADHPVSELKQYSKSVKGPKDSMLPGAMILGEKRGPFMQNLHGIESAFTADMWVSRTWNRWMGTMEVGKNDEGEDEIKSDAPRNPTERGLMKQSFEHVANKLNLSTSALQAVLWYYEQALYTKMGVPKESWSFRDAAKRVQSEQPNEEQQTAFPYGGNPKAAGVQSALSGRLPKSTEHVSAGDFINALRK